MTFDRKKNTHQVYEFSAESIYQKLPGKYQELFIKILSIQIDNKIIFSQYTVQNIFQNNFLKIVLKIPL